MAKRKSRRRQTWRFTAEKARRLRYRQFIGRPVTVSTDRQTHALVMAYARKEDLNMQAAVTRLLGYGLSVVVAQREETDRERKVQKILKSAGNR